MAKKKAVTKTKRVARKDASGQTVYVNETVTEWVTDTSSGSCSDSNSYDSSSPSCD